MRRTILDFGPKPAPAEAATNGTPTRRAPPKKLAFASQGEPAAEQRPAQEPDAAGQQAQGRGESQQQENRGPGAMTDPIAPGSPADAADGPERVTTTTVTTVTTERGYACRMCGNWFSTTQTRNRHIENRVCIRKREREE